MDLPHNEITGQVDDINVVDTAKRAEIDFSNEDHEFQGYTTWRFAFSQLLKFAGLRKTDLKEKNPEGETVVVPNAGEKIMKELDEDTLVFKFDQDDERLIAVVSQDFVSLPTGEVQQIANEVITEKGIQNFEVHEKATRSQLVDTVEFKFEDTTKEMPSVGDTLGGGLRIRNSSFGASSLRVNRFYEILACSNGMLSRRTGSEFRQVHMGDADELREKLRNEVDHHIEALWEETELVEKVHSIEFPIQDQLEFLDEVSSKITKRSASAMAARILYESPDHDLEEYVEEHSDEFENLDIPTSEPNGAETWNTGGENVWGLVNVFTGYATHSDLSSESTIQQIERVYNNIMEVDNTDDVMAIAE